MIILLFWETLGSSVEYHLLHLSTSEVIGFTFKIDFPQHEDFFWFDYEKFAMPFSIRLTSQPGKITYTTSEIDH